MPKASLHMGDKSPRRQEKRERDATGTCLNFSLSISKNIYSMLAANPLTKVLEHRLLCWLCSTYKSQGILTLLSMTVGLTILSLFLSCGFVGSGTGVCLSTCQTHYLLVATSGHAWDVFCWLHSQLLRTVDESHQGTWLAQWFTFSKFFKPIIK